jgi:peptidyl-tRNA hydrolase, PTH2 family
MSDSVEAIKLKQVIVVRKDLNMRKGKIGSQSAHASRAFLVAERLNTSGKKLPQDNEEFKKESDLWIEQSQRTICLSINSEEELVALHQKALGLGLVSHLITDHGMTEFKGVPTKTCLAIGPHPDEKFEGLTDHLPLF